MSYNKVLNYQTVTVKLAQSSVIPNSRTVQEHKTKHIVGKAAEPKVQVLIAPQPQQATEQEQQEAVRSHLCAMSGFKQLSQSKGAKSAQRRILLFSLGTAIKSGMQKHSPAPLKAWLCVHRSSSLVP